MSTTTTQPKIYVACLSAYNNGILHGAWIDASADADAMFDEIEVKVLQTSPIPDVTRDCLLCDATGKTLETSAAGGVYRSETNCPRCAGTGQAPASEEYAIHDFEDFCGIEIGEYDSLSEIAEIAAGLIEHGEAFGAAVSWLGDAESAARVFGDGDYCGEHSSEEEYAEELFDEIYLHDVPEFARNYIDYEKFSRDLFMGDYVSMPAADGNVHVFRSS